MPGLHVVQVLLGDLDRDEDPDDDHEGDDHDHQADDSDGRVQGCEWEGPEDVAVSVTVLPQGALDQWRVEATDGDGFGDGTAVEGVGDEAYASAGAIEVADGPRLLLIRAFPSFDITDDQMVALARAVEARV